MLERAVFHAEAWSEPVILGELSRPDALYLAAVVGEEIVAYGGLAGLYDADLMTLGAAPQWRGRGFGRLVLRELIAAAVAGGLERLFLEVRASNQVAIDLYTSEGFAELRRVRGYYRRPTEDAISMVRRLRSREAA